MKRARVSGHGLVLAAHLRRMGLSEVKTADRSRCGKTAVPVSGIDVCSVAIDDMIADVSPTLQGNAPGCGFDALR